VAGTFNYKTELLPTYRSVICPYTGKANFLTQTITFISRLMHSIVQNLEIKIYVA